MRMSFAAAAMVVGSFSLLASPGGAQDRPSRTSAEKRLERTLDRAIESSLPFFTPQEQALIERKCGYAPGSRDSSNINITDGVLLCTNGRRVDDPEVRAMMEVAGRRISRRIHAALESAEVRAAIAAVAAEASAEAVRSVHRQLGAGHED
jgi:hypothetical protein